MRVLRSVVAAVALAVLAIGCAAAPHDVATLSVPLPPVPPDMVKPQPPLPTLPDGTRQLLPGHRLVAYYGAAGAPGLGVLGTASPEAIWPHLRHRARMYDGRHQPRALPTYELITFLATGSRGNQGNYSSRVSDHVIRTYVRAAHRHHAMLVLDIQPGRGDFLPDAKSLGRWLRLPYVGLALDPEWKLYGNEKPLQQIGHTTAWSINRVSRWLASLTARYQLPQKPLLIHEFTSGMVRNRSRVVDHPRLATVFNVDGFGSRGAKLTKYHEFAHDGRFPLGFKLFRKLDDTMMSPRDVKHMRPAPVVIEYE